MNTPQRSIFIAWTALLIAGLLPHAAWAEDAPPTADELFRAAARSHKQEEWREAAAQWRQFLAAASGDARRETAERFLAMDLAMAGEFDEALEHFGKFVDGYPQSRHLEDVWFNLAGTALRRAQQSHEREHFQMARDAFDRVLELFPASPRRSFAVFHRAQVDLEAGQWEEAGRQFEEFVRDFPYDPLSGDADYFLGYIHFRRGNYQASVDLFQAFLANNAQPTYADQARYVCAEALLAMARFADAEAMFGQAAGSARFKDADAAILNQAMCAARQGHWEEAVRLCRNLPTRFPQSALAPRAALLAAEYLTQAGKHEEAAVLLKPLAESNRTERIQAAYLLASTYIAQGNLEAAEKTLDLILRQVDRSHELFVPLKLLQADVLFDIPARGEESVQAYLDVAARVNGEAAAAAHLRAVRAAVRAKRTKLAQEHAIAFLDTYDDPEQCDEACRLLLITARLDLEGGNRQACIDASTRVIESSRKPQLAVEARSLRARAYYNSEMWRQALEDADAVLASQPEVPTGAEMRLLRADALAKVGDHMRAIAEFDRLLAEFPEHPQADAILLAAAKSEQELLNWDQAHAAYQAFLDRFPRSEHAASAWFGQGVARRKQRRAQEAIPLFQHAVEQAPQTELAAHASFQIGESLMELRRYADAAAQFERTANGWTFPRWQGCAWFELGRCQEALGHQVDAIRTYERLIGSLPDHECAPAATSRLVPLKKASAPASNQNSVQKE